MVLKKKRKFTIKSFHDFENQIPLDNRPEKLCVYSDGKKLFMRIMNQESPLY